MVKKAVDFYCHPQSGDLRFGWPLIIPTIYYAKKGVAHFLILFSQLEVGRVWNQQIYQEIKDLCFLKKWNCHGNLDDGKQSLILPTHCLVSPYCDFWNCFGRGGGGERGGKYRSKQWKCEKYNANLSIQMLMGIIDKVKYMPCDDLSDFLRGDFIRAIWKD